MVKFLNQLNIINIDLKEKVGTKKFVDFKNQYEINQLIFQLKEDLKRMF